MEELFFESNNLSAIEQKVWSLLSEGVKSYKNPFHFGTVANIQAGIPELRTVILRKVLGEEKKLFFHTDIRSTKVDFIQKNPAMSWLFYDENSRLQLRMLASATVHFKNEVADQGWAASALSSKLTYSISNAPGTKLEAPVAVNINEKNPPPELIDFASSHFSVIETQISKLDVVFLHHRGNRRVIVDYASKELYWAQA